MLDHEVASSVAVEVPDVEHERGWEYEIAPGLVAREVADGKGAVCAGAQQIRAPVLIEVTVAPAGEQVVRMFEAVRAR